MAAEFEDQLRQLHDEDERQSLRDRVTRLETSLSVFIEHSDKTIDRLQALLAENQKLTHTLNNRMDVLNNTVTLHIDAEKSKKSYVQWFLSILVPAGVSLSIWALGLFRKTW